MGQSTQALHQAEMVKENYELLKWEWKERYE